MDIKLKSNVFWLIVLGGIVAISAIALYLLSQTSASYAHIYHDGRLTESINLVAVTDSFTKRVENNDNINVIEVEHGRIRMQKADCPDGTCVRQGWISGGVLPIVCLPNRVVITLEGGVNERGVDAVVG